MPKYRELRGLAVLVAAPGHLVARDVVVPLRAADAEAPLELQVPARLHGREVRVQGRDDVVHERDLQPRST